MCLCYISKKCNRQITHNKSAHINNTLLKQMWDAGVASAAAVVFYYA